MRKFAAMILASMLVLGLGSAQSEPWGDSYGDTQDGGNFVNLKQEINVTIPERVGFHLVGTEWNMNLENPVEGGPNEDDVQPHGCYLVPSWVADGVDVDVTDDSPNPPSLSMPESLSIEDVDAWVDYEYQTVSGDFFAGNETSNYPPVIEEEQGDGLVAKGGLLCFNTVTLQKWSNSPDGWKLTVDATSNQASDFGYLSITDVIIQEAGSGDPTYDVQETAVFNNAEGLVESVSDEPLGTIATQNGPTEGWLDDQLVQAFYFDGSEEAHDSTIVVSLTLSSL